MKLISIFLLLLILPMQCNTKFLERPQLKITSTAFGHNGRIPARYTCDGTNVNPPLHIDMVPSEAKSLVLIIDDPDAQGKTWVHWVVWNIPPTIKEISENSIPGTQGLNDFKQLSYGGPCPPSGIHRYFFKLYALDTRLTLSSKTAKSELEQSMRGHILEQAELVGLYSKL